MKKITTFVAYVLLCIFLFQPISAMAMVYYLEDDTTIELPTTFWKVVTRGTLKKENDPTLEELGLTREYMIDFFQNNQVYLNAIYYQEDGNFIELLVCETEMDYPDFNQFSVGELDTLASSFGKKMNTEDYGTYSSKYDYVWTRYSDTNVGLYVKEYYTVLGGINYTFTFQSSAPFSDANETQMQYIMKSVTFAKKPAAPSKANTSSSANSSGSSQDDFWDGVDTSFIEGAVIAVIVVCVGLLFKKKKKKENNISNEE